MSSEKRHRSMKQKRPSYLLGPLFQEVKQALIRDLADAYMRERFCNKSRGEELPEINIGCPPYVLKRIRQVTEFDKRIIWETDQSFNDLSEKCLKDFKASQKEFGLPEPLNRREYLVLEKAREICSDILGHFDWDSFFDFCAFGKRAAVGLPRQEAYLDTRMRRLGGSESQIACFNESLSRDIHLLRAVRRPRTKVKVQKVLKATPVPKSWKAARIVFPDTTLGGFLSRGLGLMMRSRLERSSHIDLALQQVRHRRWACAASKNGLRATIDMRRASDSFVWRHIQLLVPEDWHHILDVVRTKKAEVGGEDIDLTSVLLMGAGHTFPLQTILFYSLAEATRVLLKCPGMCSVYGDDIILPTSISRQFIILMTSLGFSINSSKSFFDSPDPERPSHTFFRESCGGDFKGGIDVRPYMPECDLQSIPGVPRNEYAAWCYKIYNGLTAHWDPAEIENTLRYLLSEINRTMGSIFEVPEWEVEHSGILGGVHRPIAEGLTISPIQYRRWIASYFRISHHRPKRKRKQNERPYLWYRYWLSYHGSDAAEDLYASTVSLTGEPNRRREGVYRVRRAGTQE